MLKWRALTVCAIIAVDVCKRYKRYTSRIQTLVKMFKVNFIYEEYLDSVPHNLRCFITRLRISAHSLRIHTGRFGVNRLPRHERLCLHCNLQDVEDVYHCVCICSNDKKYLYNITRYAKEALTLRNNFDFITIHLDLIVFSMYIYIYFFSFSMQGYL